MYSTVVLCSPVAGAVSWAGQCRYRGRAPPARGRCRRAPGSGRTPSAPFVGGGAELAALAEAVELELEHDSGILLRPLLELDAVPTVEAAVHLI